MATHQIGLNIIKTDIYNLESNFTESISKDIVSILGDENIRKTIKANLKKTEQEMLWTWEERLTAEINEVEKLLKD